MTWKKKKKRTRECRIRVNLQLYHFEKKKKSNSTHKFGFGCDYSIAPFFKFLQLHPNSKYSNYFAIAESVKNLERPDAVPGDNNRNSVQGYLLQAWKFTEASSSEIQTSLIRCHGKGRSKLRRCFVWSFQKDSMVKQFVDLTNQAGELSSKPVRRWSVTLKITKKFLIPHLWLKMGGLRN